MREKTEVNEVIETYMKSNGIQVSKKISSGGFLGTPVYDKRIVYSFKELRALIKEGFTSDTDLGIWLFNAFMRTERKAVDEKL